MPSQFANPPPTDFVSEELPPDFWDDEPVPHDETPSKPARPAPPPAVDKEAPLFDQLKQLFPGRVVRVEPLETVVEALADENADENLDAEEAVQDTLFD